MNQEWQDYCTLDTISNIDLGVELVLEEIKVRIILADLPCCRLKINVSRISSY